MLFSCAAFNNALAFKCFAAPWYQKALPFLRFYHSMYVDYTVT